MHSENNSSHKHLSVLHLNCCAKRPHDENWITTDLYELFNHLNACRIRQKLIVTGDTDTTCDDRLKNNMSEAPVEILSFPNSTCDLNLPREDMVSEPIERCVMDTVKDFRPDMVHIHHMQGFTASVIERLKTQYDMPIILTLHDYWCLCPTSHLVNYKGDKCSDTAHGDNCVLCYKSQALKKTHAAHHACWPGEFESRKSAWINALNLVDIIIGRSQVLKKEYIRYGIAPEKFSMFPIGDDRSANRVAYAKHVWQAYNDLVAGTIIDQRKKIELGGGETPKQIKTGYLNLDFRALPEVDVVADVKKMPFGNGAIDQLFAANLVEHFPRKAVHRTLLEWWRSLKQGGWLDILVPDLEGTLDSWRKMPFDRVLDALYGAQKFDGDYHFNGLTAASLKKTLSLTGFNHFPIMFRYNLMDVPRIFLRAQKKTRIRIFPFGDASKGSSRLRVHNIYPHLVKMGYDVNLFGDPSDCDVAIFQKVIDPHLIEQCKGVTILDVDDNIFEFTHSAADCKKMSEKVSAIVTSTAELKRIAQRYSNTAVEIIPTSIDVFRAKINPPKENNGKIRLAGWVGNPENLHYLDEIIPHLANANIRLRVITNLSKVDAQWLKKHNAHIELYEWTIERADALLRECDIGVAPLNSDAWSFSKSAVKIMKCWALGIPVICSPIPEYIRVAAEFGVTCIARNDTDWIQQLNSSPVERNQQVTKAQKELSAYMAPAVAKQWGDLVDRLVYKHHLHKEVHGHLEKR